MYAQLGVGRRSRGVVLDVSGQPRRAGPCGQPFGFWDCDWGLGICSLLQTRCRACGYTSVGRAAVARAVLDAIERRDVARLQSLALSEQEFRDHVWPALPAARPERNLPFSYVWGDLRQKSQIKQSETLAKYGGQRFSLLNVAFAGDTGYEGYRVHRDAKLRVRDDAGTESEIRVCGSMIEKDGAWKVFSYFSAD